MDAEVVHSLRILGLPPTATAQDVRSAFRRLALTYHPDVAGKYYAYKFEQISKAYAVLKDAPLPKASHESSVSRAYDAQARSGVGFGSVFTGPFAWYRKRRAERSRAQAAEREAKRRAEQDEMAAARRAAEAAREKTLLEREFRADAILRRGERMIAAFETRPDRKVRGLNMDVQGLALRIGSARPQVRCMVLSGLAGLGETVNQPEIFNALSASLKMRDIDEDTARLAAALPFTPENRRKLAFSLAGARAGSHETHRVKLEGFY